MKRFLKTISSLLVMLVMTAGCETEKRPSTLTVRLVDHPGTPTDYNAVNLEIKQVQAFYNKDEHAAGWVNLSTKSGVYNLAKLRNGMSATPVYKDRISAGAFTKIKIVLGNNNTVSYNGKSFPLDITTYEQDGLDIPAEVRINPGDWIEVKIGFDVASSVVIETGGSHRLEPVYKVLEITHAKKSG